RQRHGQRARPAAEVEHARGRADAHVARGPGDDLLVIGDAVALVERGGRAEAPLLEGNGQRALIRHGPDPMLEVWVPAGAGEPTRTEVRSPPGSGNAG